MSTIAEEQLGTVQPESYICRSITFDGFPSLPGWGSYRRGAKYFAQVTINNTDGWTTRTIRRKESSLNWKEESDRHKVVGGPTSMLQVTLFKTGMLRQTIEVGSIERPISAWLGLNSPVTLQLALRDNVKQEGAITLRLERHEETPLDVNPELLPAGLGFKDIQQSLDMALRLGGPAGEIAQAWAPLLQKVDWFMGAMDVLTEVHPYAKTAWIVLAGAYKLVIAQQGRDAQVMELLQTMHETYKFVKEARELDKIKTHPGSDTLREQALERCSTQTIECAHFITTYAKDSSFFVRLVKQTTSSASTPIAKYKESFEGIMKSFRDGSQLAVELVSFRMLGNLQDFEKKWDLQQIPYVHDAGYEPDNRCLPGTRVRILDDLTQWAQADDPDGKRICVLTGSAGTGKSAIAHTLAGRFEETHQLGSMFCFSLSEQATRSPASVFPTMARDLGRGRPAFQEALFKSVDGDMTVCGTKSIKTQFEKFILNPSLTMTISGTILIIIEALDESGDEGARRRLLDLLMSRLVELPPGFRILITCRPEHDILTALKNSPVKHYDMPNMAQETTLQRDILKYIRHKLSMKDPLAPGEHDESCHENLVRRSEGLFQWAFVACDYIIPSHGKSFGGTPQQRYQNLMKRTEGHKGLDPLYLTVLRGLFRENAEAAEPFKATMGLVLMAVEPLTMSSLLQLMDHIQDEPSLPKSRLKENTILPYLGALLSGVGKEDIPVRPLHSSFRELLCDPKRAGDFYIDPTQDHHTRLAIACLRLLCQRLAFNLHGLKSSYQPNKAVVATCPPTESPTQQDLLYACKHWGYHLSQCFPNPAGNNLDVIRDLVGQLLKEKLLFWIEAASLGGLVAELSPCLSHARNSLRELDEELEMIGADAIRFLHRFAAVLLESAPHIYLSALPWCPKDCRMMKYYRPTGLRIAQVVPSQAVWPALEFSLPGHLDRVTAVAFSEDGKHIVSGSRNGMIQVCDAMTGEPICDPFAAHQVAVTSVAFLDGGKRIVSGSHDLTLRIWHANTGEPITDPIQGHTNYITSVDFCKEKNRLVSSSGDRTIRLWDASTGFPIGTPLIHTHTVTSAVFSPDGEQIASGSVDGSVRIWEMKQSGEKHAVKCTMKAHTAAVQSVGFSQDGTRVVSGSEDHTIRIWDVLTGKPWGEPMTRHSQGVTSVAFSVDQTRIVSGSWDRTVRLWNVTTQEAVGEPLIGHTDSVTAVAFSPDSTRVVSASHDHTVRVWHAAHTNLPQHNINTSSASTDGEAEGSVSSPMWDHMPEVMSLTSFNLCSCPEHQAPRSYQPTQSKLCRMSLNYRTGWVMGENHDLLFWIPPDMTRKLPVGREQLGVPGPAVHVDFSRFIHGDEWIHVLDELDSPTKPTVNGVPMLPYDP